MSRGMEKVVADALSKHDVLTVSVSMGRDSLVVWKLMQELGGKKLLPVHWYDDPELPSLVEQKKMYEDLFGQEIYMLPNITFYDDMTDQVDQPYATALWLSQFDWGRKTYAELLFSWLTQDMGYTDEEAQNIPTVTGVRASESMQRRQVFAKYGPVRWVDDMLQIHPIWDWKKHDVREFMSERKIPLTDDYKIWGRSLDGLNYQWLIGLEKHRPADYASCVKMWPMIPAELHRYKFNQKYAVAPVEKTNPMIDLHGKGPDAMTCKNCSHVFQKQFSATGGKYYKCDLRVDTAGATSDHRSTWPTCSKFKYRTGDVKVVLLEGEGHGLMSKTGISNRVGSSAKVVKPPKKRYGILGQKKG